MNVASKMELGAAAIDARDRFDPAHRAAHMNASEADTCIRKQWYTKNRPELGEDQRWGYARRGHYGERYVVDALKAANVDLRLAGDDQETLAVGSISATPDGVIVDHEVERLIGIEIKTIDPRKNVSALPMREHETQLKIAMRSIVEHAGRLGLPDWPMSHGVIIYLNASDFDNVIEKTVLYSDTIIDQLQPRAEKLLRARSAHRLPREGKLVGGGSECKYRCAFSSVCLSGDDVSPGTTKTGRGNRGSRLEESVEAYLKAKLDEDDAKARKAAEAERVKAELKARSVNELEVGDHHVKLVQVAGRKSLDKKAIANELGVDDLSDFETVGKPSERLTIT